MKLQPRKKSCYIELKPILRSNNVKILTKHINEIGSIEFGKKFGNEMLQEWKKLEQRRQDNYGYKKKTNIEMEEQ